VAILEGSAAVQVMDHHGIVLIDVAGELTALETPSLLTAVADALATSPRNLQIGLAGITFLDSGGLEALVRIRAAAGSAKVPLQLLGPTARTHRLLDVSGLAGVFELIE
jgi:anti-sigma B factor antagonist